MESKTKGKIQERSQEPRINIYEDLCLRFPSVAESIFDELDNQSLVKCKEVSGVWRIFLQAPKFLIMRKIQKMVETRRKFRKVWKLVGQKISTNEILQLEVATAEFYGNDRNFSVSDPEFESVSDIDSETNCITPIHVAAGTGHLILWETLIQKTSLFEPKNEKGQTPYHYAAALGFVGICLKIIEKPTHNPTREEILPRDNDGWTPLHYAAKEGQLDVYKTISYLAEDKNPKDLEDFTPLHAAAMNFNRELCEFIVSKIQDKNPVDKDGDTPMDLWIQASFKVGRKMFGLQ